MIVLLCSLPLIGCAGLERWQRQLALRPTPTLPGQSEAATASLRPGDERFLVPVPSNLIAAAPQQVAMWWLP